MSSPSRRTRLSVIEHLVANPQDYSFVQAVRLLERSAIFESRDQHNNENTRHRTLHSTIARFSPPAKECIKFSAVNDLSFPASEIHSIKRISENNQYYWHVRVNLIGLTGTMGVMPFHYSEMILKRLKFKDHSLANFLDLFNHRTSSLFFQSSVKYHLALDYERHALRPNNTQNEGHHSQILLSLLGLGTNDLRNRQAIRDESLIYYGGLLTQQTKTPSGLKQLIQSYFDVPVSINSFVGQWHELIEDVRTQLPSKQKPKGQNVCLGRSTMLGSKGWFTQGKSQITIGPLNKVQFDKFSPGTGALKALNQLVGTYLGMEQNFDFVIEVKRDDIPNKVKLKKDNPPQLAWNAWLAGKNKSRSKGELLEIVISSKKLH